MFYTHIGPVKGFQILKLNRYIIKEQLQQTTPFLGVILDFIVLVQIEHFETTFFSFCNNQTEFK